MNSVASGNVAYAPSFISVGTQKMNLADITVVSDAYVSPGNVVIQTLNTDGTTDVSYYWIYNKTHGGESGTAGWYKAKTGKVEDLITKDSGIVFEPGAGFWLQGAGKKLQCSGQVLTDVDVAVTTPASGNVLVANPFPTALSLADINVISDAYISPGNVVAQTLNTDGTTAVSYYWIYNKTHGGESGTAGWYKAKTGKVEDLITKESGVELAPGESYWVQGAGKQFKISALKLK